MRDYAKVSPTFWMNGPGKRLRGHPEAQTIALYLMSSPSANMIGLYYLPLSLLCHETGLDAQGAREALAKTSDADFAYYDEESDLVWVPNAAAEQIGETLQPGDKQRVGVVNELRRFGDHRFVKDFLTRYAEAYSLSRESSRERKRPLRRGLEGPSKALRSQDQDQKQEQDQEHDQKQEQDPPISPLEGATDDELQKTLDLLIDEPDTKQSRKRAQVSGTRISADWKPTPETVDLFRREGIDADACIAEFVDYWLGVPGSKALKADWEATFRNRVRTLAARDEAPPWHPPLREYVPPPDPVDAVSPEEARANLAQLQEILSNFGRLPFSDDG